MAVQAYADDLVLIQQNPQMMDQMLAEIGHLITIMGLKCNAKKCASLVMRKGKVLYWQHSIMGDAIPSLAKMDAYNYLGWPKQRQHQQGILLGLFATFSSST